MFCIHNLFLFTHFSYLKKTLNPFPSAGFGVRRKKISDLDSPPTIKGMLKIQHITQNCPANKKTLFEYFIDQIKYLFFLLSRALSTANRSAPLAANTTAVSKDESREFMSVFPGNVIIEYVENILKHTF